MSDKPEKPSVELISTRELEDEYRALLLSEWTPEHFLRCLRLVEDQIRLSGLLILFPWEQQQRPRKSRQRPLSQRISPNAAEYVREFVEHFNPDLPEVPTEMPARQNEEKVQLARIAEKTSAYLTLQILLKLGGAVGFLKDSQSLLFSASIHTLLPDLTSRGMLDERHLLLNSLWTHLKLAWDDSGTHKHFLLSQFFSATDEPERALAAMYQSFQLTDVTSHDWITKAQAYWAGLIEASHLDAARDFVLHTLRTAPLETVAELTELVDETYHYIHKARGRRMTGPKARSA